MVAVHLTIVMHSHLKPTRRTAKVCKSFLPIKLDLFNALELWLNVQVTIFFCMVNYSTLRSTWSVITIITHITYIPYHQTVYQYTVFSLQSDNRGGVL